MRRRGQTCAADNDVEVLNAAGICLDTFLRESLDALRDEFDLQTTCQKGPKQE